MLDWFAIFNIAILLMALCLTVTIHVLSKKGRTSLAVTADKAVRPTIYLLYAIGLSGFLLYSVSSGDAAATVVYFTTWSAALLGGATTYVTVSTQRRHARMVKLATQVLNKDFAEKDEEHRHAILEKLFHMFDTDRSGSLDEKEAAVLVRVLYDKLHHKLHRQNSTVAVKTLGYLHSTRNKHEVDDNVDELLQRMLTLRLHLDDVDQENGALEVIPGSHQWTGCMAEGIESKVRIDARAGDVLAMRPLIQHSSAASDPQTRRHRRIVHLEFAADPQLPSGYQWHRFESC